MNSQSNYSLYFNFSTELNTTLLTLSQKIQNSNGQIIGVTGLDLNMKDLQDNILSPIYVISNKTYVMVLVDQNGIILNFPLGLNLSQGMNSNYSIKDLGNMGELYESMIGNTVNGTSGTSSFTLNQNIMEVDTISLNFLTNVNFINDNTL